MVVLDLNTIYLKNAFDSLVNGYGTMVHEAAHLLHSDLDSIISELWVKKFPIKREIGSCPEKIMLDNGLVSSYAGFDITSDSLAFSKFMEDDNPVSTLFHSSGIEIIIHGESRDISSLVGGVVEQCLNLPTNYLRSIVKRVIVSPSLNFSGLVSCYGCSKNYLRCTEDVAESTQVFNQAASSNNLSSINRVYDLLHGSFKDIGFASEKLKVLDEYGFIGCDDVSNLFDSDFLLSRIESCEKTNFNNLFRNGLNLNTLKK
jgi:hypothetical protein